VLKEDGIDLLDIFILDKWLAIPERSAAIDNGN
jgi:hypothetical protein